MTPAPPHLLADITFRRGLACLRPFGLSFDTLVFHTQLDEVRDLADAFPDTLIILNHVWHALGVGEHALRRAEVFASWSTAMQTLAVRPNVYVKVGGMGMPLFGFGFERCIFESNFPVDKQSCGYKQLWNAFKLTSHALSQDERRDLFYRTACRVYRLPGSKRMEIGHGRWSQAIGICRESCHSPRWSKISIPALPVRVDQMAPSKRKS